MVFLMDSGSSTSFISATLATQLTQFQPVPQTAQVQITGGGFLQSSGILHSVPWSVDQCDFHSNFRVLELSAFDAIIGVDWLQTFSPMHVHWEQKWLAIPYNGNWAVLQGMDTNLPDLVCLHLFAVQDESSNADSVEPLP